MGYDVGQIVIFQKKEYVITKKLEYGGFKYLLESVSRNLFDEVEYFWTDKDSLNYHNMEETK